MRARTSGACGGASSLPAMVLLAASGAASMTAAAPLPPPLRGRGSGRRLSATPMPRSARPSPPLWGRDGEGGTGALRRALRSAPVFAPPQPFPTRGEGEVEALARVVGAFRSAATKRPLPNPPPLRGRGSGRRLSATPMPSAGLLSPPLGGSGGEGGTGAVRRGLRSAPAFPSPRPSPTRGEGEVGAPAGEVSAHLSAAARDPLPACRWEILSCG